MFEVMNELSKHQSEALKAQDKLIVDRVESRLEEVQVAFLKRTEDEATRIFAEKNDKLFTQMSEIESHLQEIDKTHIVQEEVFDKQNRQAIEAIESNNEIKRIFTEESQAFFSERIKWKQEFMTVADNQNVRLEHNTEILKKLETQNEALRKIMVNMVEVLTISAKVQRQAIFDLKKVNVMGKSTHNEILQNALASDPKTAGGIKLSAESKNWQDPRTTGKVIKAVKMATLEF